MCEHILYACKKLRSMHLGCVCGLLVVLANDKAMKLVASDSNTSPAWPPKVSFDQTARREILWLVMSIRSCIVSGKFG